ncbi:spore protease YyaC [Ornithinibacillus halophilus]|uniref:Putative sporulation protein YyaC n=1 Tax=Ornithinibacillus halophilus TaxID=930117 RepID=A0A1M5M4X0_9BACI|nr:spore protease YyaC [Ornithinibacillus halophilus]SHG72325.1 putative sporulation protein YyaC [Ornithinibacillus halophilus]
MNLKNHFKTKKDTFRMKHTEANLTEYMQEQIIAWLPNYPREYVVVCVGTDRSTGDSLGPLTGSYLTESRPKHLTVYGTLQDPVHATNLHDYIKLIKTQHQDPFIIAVDACLGRTDSVGCIIANKGALKPGAALKKPLPEIGDIHLTGVVNISGFMEYSVLQNTRLSIVVELSKKLATILDAIDKQLTYKNITPAVVLPHIKEKSI